MEVSRHIFQALGRWYLLLWSQIMLLQKLIQYGFIYSLPHSVRRPEDGVTLIQTQTVIKVIQAESNRCNRRVWWLASCLWFSATAVTEVGATTHRASVSSVSREDGFSSRRGSIMTNCVQCLISELFLLDVSESSSSPSYVVSDVRTPQSIPGMIKQYDNKYKITNPPDCF